jgi:hypothetical protein
VPAQEFAGRVNTQARIREEIMPARLERRIGLLSNQCIRQPNSRTTFAHQILPEIVFYLPCLMAQQGQKSHRQRHQSVFSSFTANHPNLPIVKIDILDSQKHQLDTPQSRAIQHGGHQIINSIQLTEQSGHFLSRQHDEGKRGLPPFLSLQSAASLQVAKNVKPIVLDYDATTRKMSIVDRGFLIWLDNQDRDDLLELAGLPKGSS